MFPSTDHSFPSWDRPAACAWPSPPPCAGPSRKRAFPRANGSANSASALSLEAGGPGRGRGGSECCAHVHTAHGGLEGALLREPSAPPLPPPPGWCGAGAEVQRQARFSGAAPRRGLVLSADRGPGRGLPPEPREPSHPGSVFRKWDVAWVHISHCWGDSGDVFP